MATGGPVVDVEINGQRTDNADRFWNTHWHPLLDTGGRVIGINVAAEEITERKKVQASLSPMNGTFESLPILCLSA